MNQRLFERALSAPHLVTVDLAHDIAEAIVCALYVEHPELMTLDNVNLSPLQLRALALLRVACQLQQSLRKYSAAVEHERKNHVNEDVSF